MQGLCRSCSPYNKLRNYTARPKPGKPNQIGVEIECLARDELGHRALSNVSNYCCSDGSLDAFGAEIKIVAHESFVTKKTTAIAGRCATAGAYVDGTCGFHVHLDMRPVWHVMRYDNVLRWLKRAEDLFFSAIPPSRRSSSFCRPINGAFYQDHYTWVNFTNLQTLEIRVHPGTLNQNKIAGWLDVCRQLGNLVRDFCVGSSPVTTWNTSPFTGLGQEYLAARLAGGGVLSLVDKRESRPLDFDINPEGDL